MKWRSTLVLAFVAFALLFPSFSASKIVSAQENTTYNYSYFSSQTQSIFSSTLSNVTTRCEQNTSSQDYVNLCAALIPLLNQASAAYLEEFNAKQGSGVSPSEAQSAAIARAQSVFSASRPTALLPRVPQINAVIQTYEGQMRNSADEARNVTTTGGGGGVIVNATAPANAGNPSPSSKDCGFTNPGACIDAVVAWIIQNTLLQFAGFFLWAGANLLDYIIRTGILDFASWAPNSLYPLWQVVRQVISMFVVFSGLFIGFMYIIGKNETFNRYFAWIIIFGLFVNFSYPITRAAIDLSNIVSLNIYASAMGPGYVLTKPGEASSQTSSAGAKIMSRLGLQSLVFAANSKDATSRASTDVLGQTNSTWAMLLIVGYVFYAAYIFIFAAAILMIRTLVLSFVIVASPLLFVDSVIPKLGEMAQKLRKFFFEQLSVSIVFMIMLYLSMALLDTFKIGGPVSGGTDSITQIFNVLMMLIVLHIMLKVTKAVAGAIGESVSNAVGKVGGFAGGLALGAATGGAGLLARGTIGAAAARWSTNEALESAQGATGLKGWGARRVMDMSKSLASSSFDARNTQLMGSISGAMGGAAMTKGMSTSSNLLRLRNLEKEKEETSYRASMLKGDSRDAYIQSRGRFADSGLSKKMNTVDAETLQKYAGSSNDVRETMKLDEKNRQYVNQFGDIDKMLDPNIPDDERKRLLSAQGDEKLKKAIQNQIVTLAAKKTTDQIAEVTKFFNTPEEARGNLKTFATNKEEEDLYSKLEAYANIKGETGEDLAQKAKILVDLGNPTLAKAVIGEDTPYKDNKQNQALQNKIQASYNVAAGKALTSAQKIQQAQNEAIAAASEQITNEQTKILEDISKTDFSEMIQRTVKGDASKALEGTFNTPKGGPSSTVGGNPPSPKQTPPQQSGAEKTTSGAVV